MDLSSLITLATIVFSMLKITRGLKIFWETGPMSYKGHSLPWGPAPEKSWSAKFIFSMEKTDLVAMQDALKSVCPDLIFFF